MDDLRTQPDGETMPPRHPFAQHRLVRLVQDFDGPYGRIRSGTVATVLETIKGGVAYVVEFEGPNEVPETVTADLLEAYDGAA